MISTETLRWFPLFAGMDYSFIKLLARNGEKVTLKKGEWLFHEKDHADALYIILSGRIDIIIRLGMRDIAPPGLTILGKGDVLGWSALVHPQKYTMGAVAIVDCQLVKLAGGPLCALMDEHPEMGFLLMGRLTQILGERLTNLRTRFVSLIEGDRWQSFSQPRRKTTNN
jgi:CRP-like cAMP-binding protein